MSAWLRLQPVKQTDYDLLANALLTLVAKAHCAVQHCCIVVALRNTNTRVMYVYVCMCVCVYV